jgi:hypothetical protein
VVGLWPVRVRYSGGSGLGLIFGAAGWSESRHDLEVMGVRKQIEEHQSAKDHTLTCQAAGVPPECGGVAGTAISCGLSREMASTTCDRVPHEEVDHQTIHMLQPLSGGIVPGFLVDERHMVQACAFGVGTRVGHGRKR